MAIAMSKTRENYPLSTKKVLKKTLASGGILSLIFLVVGFFLMLALVTVVEPLTATYFFLGIALFVILLIVMEYLYQKWYYNVYFYDFTQDYIVIRKGPITPKEITIPYERIQDVYVDQDLLDRMFGLYDVHLSSATISSGMQAHIDGVEKAAADGLRAELLGVVSKRISKKSVAEPNAA